MPISDPKINEVDDLIEMIHARYGYDFRDYARASLSRRIHYHCSKRSYADVAELKEHISSSPVAFEDLLLSLSVNTTALFRDPSFYKTLRENVIPVLKTYPSIKIWNAGCSSGEEAYSIAIVLKEEGIYDKSLIYATDFNKVILQNAKRGIFTLDVMKTYTQNYQNSGGVEPFCKYYLADSRSAIMDQSLKKNIVFAEHNLVTDKVFSEMHLILCRNVLIYFNRDLQNHVFRLLRDSVCRNGFLCLGSKETMGFSDCRKEFKEFDKREKIYQKLYSRHASFDEL